uniref:Variant surface glycoprotein 1125.63 n=1 Tax=Trypanosoma brucei TaxID=5691 RepID=A0A1J0R557_9TRYP|nr:variant surface glycoprotein 1125.63 [Trypanosoma brucei]
MTHIVSLSVIVSAITIGAESAASKGLKKDVWEPICGLSEELDLVGGDVLAESDEILKYAFTIKLQAARAKVYATKNIGSTEGRKAYLFAAYLDGKGDTAYQTYRASAVTSHIRAARASGYLKGRIDDFLKMLAQTTSANNACVLQAASADSEATHAAGKLRQTACALTISNIAKQKQATRQYVTSAGYEKLLEGNGAGDAHQANGGSKQCNLLAAHNADGFTHTSSATTAVNTMAGYMKIPNSAGNVELETANNLKNKAGAAEAAWQEAHQAISGIVTSEAADFKNDTETTDKWTKLTDIVRRVLLPTDKKSATDVEAAITNELRGKDKEKITELEGIINEETIPAGVAGLPQEKKLGVISSLEELTAILYHYELTISNEITDLKRKLQNKTEKKPTTTEEVCKSHTTDAPCRKAGCEFDKDKTPKCFPKPNESKEEKEKEGDDGKTGSASICAGKPKGECKSPDCKWEGETCKDSSFLLNKQFTLSVVSAAFVALLF